MAMVSYSDDLLTREDLIGYYPYDNDRRATWGIRNMHHEWRFSRVGERPRGPVRRSPLDRVADVTLHSRVSRDAHGGTIAGGDYSFAVSAPGSRFLVPKENAGGPRINVKIAIDDNEFRRGHKPV